MLKLMYITNRPEIARIAENAGVDRIFVDLETIGKKERQGGMDTVQSKHTIDDIASVRAALTNAELLVRSNPMHTGSKAEIDAILANGADVVMLPYFKTCEEVADFVRFVDGRAKTNLLVETAEAAEKIDQILALGGIDEIHIGLNDLHLALHKKFMFELLIDGTVERLRNRITERGIPFGIGGVARIGVGMLPAELIIKEHYRLGSTCAILSRSFCDTGKVTDLEQVREIFDAGLRQIRELEKEIVRYRDYFADNRQQMAEAINRIVTKA